MMTWLSTSSIFWGWFFILLMDETFIFWEAIFSWICRRWFHVHTWCLLLLPWVTLSCYICGWITSKLGAISFHIGNMHVQHLEFLTSVLKVSCTRQHIQGFEIYYYYYYFNLKKKVKELEIFFPIILWKIVDTFYLEGVCERTKTDDSLKISKSCPTLVSLMVVS